MSNHLPLNPEKNILLTLKLDDGSVREIPVSKLPPEIREEVEISDDIKRHMCEAYHRYNRLQLSYQGHQMLLQGLLREHFTSTETEESS